MKQDLFNKVKVTKQELQKYYAEHYPFEPNDQRIGRFAKQMGYVPTKQMKNGKYERFYIKQNITEG